MEGRRRDVPLRRSCRRRSAGRKAAEGLRRGGADRRRREGARPADPRPRAQRHPFRHGLPAAAEPPRQRRSRCRQSSPPILAKGKHVVVIGGGDTGSDCIGTSIRQGAKSVTNFEIMPQPPEHENKPLTWPLWPLKLRTSSSHEEGVDARLRGADDEVHRRERPGEEAALRARRRQVPADPRHRVRARRRSRAARHGLRASGARGHDQGARRSSSIRAATSRPTRSPTDLAAEGVRRRRHAPRPVAGGVGDPRGPPMRPRDRQVPDGSDRRCRGDQSRRAIGHHRKNGKKSKLRCRCVLLRLRLLLRRRGVRAARRSAAATGRASRVRRRHGGLAAPASSPASARVVVATTGSVPNGAMPRRGQAKSSPRPAGGPPPRHSPARGSPDFGLGRVAGVARRRSSSCAGGRRRGQRHHRTGERPRAPGRPASRRRRLRLRLGSTAAPPAPARASARGGFRARR